MPRPSRIAELRQQYNALIPAAHALGLNRVDYWVRPRVPPSVAIAERRLATLRRQMAERGYVAPTTQTAVPGLIARPGPVAVTVTPTSLDANLDVYTFGVEFEVFLPDGSDPAHPRVSQNDLAARLQAIGVDCRVEPYNHQPRAWWKIVTDGSLGDYQHGCEVVSPSLAPGLLRGTAGFDEMRKVAKSLDEIGCQLRRGGRWPCGFHVHVGVGGRDVGFFRRLIGLYAYFEDAIDTIVAGSRRGNNYMYARSTKLLLEDTVRKQRFDAARSVAELAIAYVGRPNILTMMTRGQPLPRMDRRSVDTFLMRETKVNMAAHWRHGTVEFRHHQGTVSADKAEHWVKLVLRLIHAAAEGVIPEGPPTLQNLATTLNMPESELRFFERRVGELTRARRRRNQ